MRLLACGGALLEPDLTNKLITLGWQIAIGYGLTETSPLLTIRMPANPDLKSVGRPIPGVQVRIEKVKEPIEENDAQNKIKKRAKQIINRSISKKKPANQKIMNNLKFK